MAEFHARAERVWRWRVVRFGLLCSSYASAATALGLHMSDLDGPRPVRIAGAAIVGCAPVVYVACWAIPAAVERSRATRELQRLVPPGGVVRVDGRRNIAAPLAAATLVAFLVIVALTPGPTTSFGVFGAAFMLSCLVPLRGSSLPA